MVILKHLAEIIESNGLRLRESKDEFAKLESEGGADAELEKLKKEMGL